jgi:hypothetical protein
MKRERVKRKKKVRVRRRDLRMSVSEIYCCEWKIFGSCF